MSCLSVSSCFRKQKNTTHPVQLLMIRICVWKQRTRAHLSRKTIPETSTTEKDESFLQHLIYFHIRVIFFPWDCQKPYLGKYVKLLCFQLVIGLTRNSFKAQPKLCCTRAYTSCTSRLCEQWAIHTNVSFHSLPTASVLQTPMCQPALGIFILFLLGDS